MDDISANNQQEELQTDVKKDRSLLYMGLGLGIIVLVMGYLTFFVEDVNNLFVEKEITTPVIEDRSAMNENEKMDDAEVRSSLIKFVEAFHYDQRRGYFDPPSYFAAITQTYYNYHNLTHKRLRDFHYKRLADMQNLKESWIVSSLNYERQGSDLVVTYWSQLDYLRPSRNVQESADVKNEMIINSEGKITSLREIDQKNFTSYAVMPEIDSTYMGEETGYAGPGSETDPAANPTEAVNLKYEGKLDQIC